MDGGFDNSNRLSSNASAPDASTDASAAAATAATAATAAATGDGAGLRQPSAQHLPSMPPPQQQMPPPQEADFGVLGREPSDVICQQTPGIMPQKQPRAELYEQQAAMDDQAGMMPRQPPAHPQPRAELYEQQAAMDPQPSTRDRPEGRAALRHNPYRGTSNTGPRGTGSWHQSFKALPVDGMAGTAPPRPRWKDGPRTAWSEVGKLICRQ